MSMQTVSLLDDEKSSILRTDLNLHEIHETRLVRADLESRSRSDPLQRWLHKQLRAFRYRRLSAKYNNTGTLGSLSKSCWSYQNTVLIASIAVRVLTSVFAGLFLVVPLVFLSEGELSGPHLAVICTCILVFSTLIASMLKVTNYELLAASAAYAAILSVFVSKN